jgi:hypothetical protein
MLEGVGGLSHHESPQLRDTSSCEKCGSKGEGCARDREGDGGSDGARMTGVSDGSSYDPIAEKLSICLWCGNFRCQ